MLELHEQEAVLDCCALTVCGSAAALACLFQFYEPR